MGTNQATQMWTRRDRVDRGLLGWRDHAACLCSASLLSFHRKSLQPRGLLFGKHLFGLEISISPVNLPDPSPPLTEWCFNLRHIYIFVILPLIIDNFKLGSFPIDNGDIEGIFGSLEFIQNHPLSEYFYWRMTYKEKWTHNVKCTAWWSFTNTRWWPAPPWGFRICFSSNVVSLGC